MTESAKLVSMEAAPINAQALITEFSNAAIAYGRYLPANDKDEQFIRLQNRLGSARQAILSALQEKKAQPDALKQVRVEAMRECLAECHKAMSLQSARKSVFSELEKVYGSGFNDGATYCAGGIAKLIEEQS